MKTKLQFVEISKIQAVSNVRGAESEFEYMADGSAYVDSICSNGMQEPPMVYNRGDFYEILRGHSRMNAQHIIRVTRPDDHKRLWPSDKIKVCVVSELDTEPEIVEREILKLKNDFVRRNLKNRYEIVEAACMLFDARCTEKEVVTELATLLGEISGPRKAKVAEYQKEMLTCDDARKAELVKLCDTEIFEYRRGKVQGLKVYWNNAFLVKDCLFLEHYGRLPKHYEDGASLPILTQAQVKKLSQQFVADEKAYANNELDVKPTKFAPSHAWVDLFKSISLEIENKVDARKTAPVKSMSRADIIAPLKDVGSQAMEKLIKYHSADKSVTGDIVTTVDKDLQVVEYLKSENKWQELVDQFESYMKKKLAMQVRAESRKENEL